MHSCQIAQPLDVCGVFTHMPHLHPTHSRRHTAKSKQYEHHFTRSVEESLPAMLDNVPLTFEYCSGFVEGGMSDGSVGSGSDSLPGAGVGHLWSCLAMSAFAAFESINRNLISLLATSGTVSGRQQPLGGHTYDVAPNAC